MLNESTADSHTVYLCLGRMAQVRVQWVALLQTFLGLLLLDSAAEGRTSLKHRGWCGAEALVPRRVQRAVRVSEFVGHAPRRLDVVSSPAAAATLTGRFLVGAGLQRAVARLDRPIVLRRIGRREEGADLLCGE